MLQDISGLLLLLIEYGFDRVFKVAIVFENVGYRREPMYNLGSRKKYSHKLKIVQNSTFIAGC